MNRKTLDRLISWVGLTLTTVLIVVTDSLPVEPIAVGAH
jgi:hypothetical protein